MRFFPTGHGILLASESIHHTATHKGTSTLSQDPRPDAKVANCDGTPFDLMHYFRDYEENCLGITFRLLTAKLKFQTK